MKEENTDDFDYTAVNILKQIDALDIGLGAVSALAVPGALGYALQTRNKAQTGQELLSTQNRPSAKGQAGLPKDYIGLPRQAPPLPGDLGKPILNVGAAPNTVGVTPDPLRL